MVLPWVTYVRAKIVALHAPRSASESCPSPGWPRKSARLIAFRAARSAKLGDRGSTSLPERCLLRYGFEDGMRRCHHDDGGENSHATVKAATTTCPSRTDALQYIGSQTAEIGSSRGRRRASGDNTSLRSIGDPGGLPQPARLKHVGAPRMRELPPHPASRLFPTDHAGGPPRGVPGSLLHVHCMPRRCGNTHGR